MTDPYELTDADAEAYCQEYKGQRVRAVLREIVGDGTVLDIGCGNGIDAERYDPDDYLGLDGSLSLVRAARRLHPRHQFVQGDARAPSTFDWPTWAFAALGFGVPERWAFAMVKSVLEHTRTIRDAFAILERAGKSARTVLVAWHTPPVAGLDGHVLRDVVGHFGRTIHQNTYMLEPFLFWMDQHGKRLAEVTTVDLFTVWRITDAD